MVPSAPHRGREARTAQAIPHGVVLYDSRIHVEASVAHLLATKDRIVRELMEMTLPLW